MTSHDRELLAAIKAEGRETYGTGRLRTRYGRCHEIAATTLWYGHPRLPEGTVMVQGTDCPMIPRRHSWLKLPDGRVWCPVTCQFDSLNILHVDAEFGREQVAEAMSRFGFFGWWAPTDGWARAHMTGLEKKLAQAKALGKVKR